MSIRVDAFNFSRKLLLRFSLVAAFAAMLSLFMYISGNVGAFSSLALFAALRSGSMTGIAAVVFSVAGLVATFAAPVIGAKFSGFSLPVLLITGILGLMVAIVSSVLLELTSGLSM